MRSRIARPAFAALAAAALLAVTGCQVDVDTAGGPPSGDDSTLTVAIDRSIDSLDPHESGSSGDRHVLANIFDRLVETDVDGGFVPGLATSWEVSADELSYTFRLREGVTFHNGEAFDADAVAANIERMRELARSDEIATISSVDVVDPLTVRFRLSEPFGGLLATLADRAGMMVAPEAARDRAAFAAHPVGTGPFEFASQTTGDSVTLTRNEDYWTPGTPTVDRVVFRIIPDTDAKVARLLAGELDLVDTVSPQSVPRIENNDSLRLSTRELTFNIRVYFNSGRAPFDDVRLRRAVAAAIDRTEAARVANGEYAVPAPGPFPGVGQVPQADPDTARRLAAEAGVAPRFSMLVNADDPAQSRLAQTLQSQLAQAGITMEIDAREYGAMLSQYRSLDYDAILLTNSGLPTLGESYYRNFHPDGSAYESGFADETVHEHLAALRANSDEARGPELERRLADDFAREVPQVTLFFFTDLKAVSQRVQGFQHYADGVLRLAKVGRA
ncbi:ABC transporter substrate-binding protein [Prauserella endophytica]|uniref:Solute-binding protein family 5 domain-containing protein n=1 Tax=Prauserella endophytica TaxID=1592324 RepID=A0ABY2S400_9PSEU|nr:ABC transporter substrate-binding protein [Prauserella endophytica]TKG70522.1 hypothetical protein FCN18_16680 [Prauserella endophytica]